MVSIDTGAVHTWQSHQMVTIRQEVSHNLRAAMQNNTEAKANVSVLIASELDFQLLTIVVRKAQTATPSQEVCRNLRARRQTYALPCRSVSELAGPIRTYRISHWIQSSASCKAESCIDRGPDDATAATHKIARR